MSRFGVWVSFALLAVLGGCSYMIGPSSEEHSKSSLAFRGENTQNAGMNPPTEKSYPGIEIGILPTLREKERENHFECVLHDCTLQFGSVHIPEEPKKKKNPIHTFLESLDQYVTFEFSERFSVSAFKLGKDRGPQMLAEFRVDDYTRIRAWAGMNDPDSDDFVAAVQVRRQNPKLDRRILVRTAIGPPPSSKQ